MGFAGFPAAASCFLVFLGLASLCSQSAATKPGFDFQASLPTSRNQQPRGHGLLSTASESTYATTATTPPSAADPTADYAAVLEIAKPVVAPRGRKCVVHVMTNRPFVNTVPYRTVYQPPKGCGLSWGRIKLSLSGSVNALQYDRLLDIYFDGLHLLGTSTPIGLQGGITWNFNVPVSRYGAFLKKKRDVTVTLPNLVDGIDFQGIFNLTMSLTFYPGRPPARLADVIVPIGSRDSGPASFAITNRTRQVSKVLSGLPRNIYRAQLEIRSTATGRDQLSYAFAPSRYVNQLPEDPGYDSGSTFREVLAYVDGALVGAVWPKAIVYPTGLLYEFWLPVVGIGAFVAPTYFIEITPFVGRLVDGKSHNFSLAVEGVSVGSTWFTDAVLHLWLDKGRKQTSGALISSRGGRRTTPKVNLKIAENRFDANVTTTATHSMTTVGYVATSWGNYTSTVTRRGGFSNTLRTLEEGLTDDISHRVSMRSQVVMRSKTGNALHLSEESFSYPLELTREYFPSGDGEFQVYASYSQAFNSRQSAFFKGYGNLTERLDNKQSGNGFSDSLGTGGATVKQEYTYKSNRLGCYSRSYRGGYASLLDDKISTTC